MPADRIRVLDAKGQEVSFSSDHLAPGTRKNDSLNVQDDLIPAFRRASLAHEDHLQAWEACNPLC